MITNDEAKEILRECFGRDSYVNDYMSQPHIMLMVKDPVNDVVLWVNQAVAEKVGQPVDKISGTHSSVYWPDLFEKFHQDDDDVRKSGEDRLRFTEAFDLDGGAPLLLTSKFNIEWKGKPALMVIAVDGEEFVRDIGARARGGNVGRAYQPGAARNLMTNFDEARALLSGVVRNHDG